MKETSPVLEALILTGTAVLWIPVGAAAIVTMDAVAYAPAKTIYQKIFDNPENKSITELYCRNFLNFIREEKK